MIRTEELHPVWIIARREVRDQFRDWRIIFPIVGLTIFFPFLMNFTAQQMLGFVERYGASIIGERLIPFLLMIVGFFPISVSLVIALESFVGEKERGSIEPLLNTPLKDWQLYLGKLLSATVPPLFSSYLGMGVYLLGLSLVGVPIPEAPLLAQIAVLAVVQAVAMVSAAVVVSSQATSVRSANLLASLIIIPAALLIQGESVVMFWGNYLTLWWVVVGLMALTVLLVRVGLAHFQREELLGHEIDVLNPRWMFRVFAREFIGGAHSLRQWYFQSVPAALAELRVDIWLTAGIAALSVWLGMEQIHRFSIPLDNIPVSGLNERLQSLVQMWSPFAFRPVIAIWWHNMRTLLLGMVLGAFSLGIFGLLPIIGTMGAVGYLYSLLMTQGFPAPVFLGLLFPHGLLEIPAVILATAAVLKAGVLMATPTTGKTVGEIALTALANWCKVMLGVVVPLLLIAAGLEVWVTPRVAMLFFH